MVLLKILNFLFGLGMSRYGLALNDSAHESLKVFDHGFSSAVAKVKELAGPRGPRAAGSAAGSVLYFIRGRGVSSLLYTTAVRYMSTKRS